MVWLSICYEFNKQGHLLSRDTKFPTDVLPQLLNCCIDLWPLKLRYICDSVSKKEKVNSFPEKILFRTQSAQVQIIFQKCFQWFLLYSTIQKILKQKSLWPLQMCWIYLFLRYIFKPSWYFQNHECFNTWLSKARKSVFCAKQSSKHYS